ncbi:hypothetical protein DHEL01_v211900 [Diaporthe helianthi]|uniref:Uncharacterized protein n=1 Tax=Diaporthe helianthi TaxID=158607 RepID=A0A2P5HHI0_DIAHE|nr:hypothetical protein DHEL01_v211900 [Diaporthe helianthi]
MTPIIFTDRSEQCHRSDDRKKDINSTHAADPIPSTTGRPEKRQSPPEPNPPPSSRTPKRRCERPERPNLGLFTRDFKFARSRVPDTPDRAAPGSPADTATTAALDQCVDLALRLLEEGRGNRVLVAMGKRIVAERRDAATAVRAAGGGGGGGPEAPAGIYKGDLGDMQMWVGRFLRQVREVGIPIVVCDSLSGYGLTQRWSWGTEMEDYDCRNSAIVYIHQCLVDGLLESARQVEHYTRAHEMFNAEIQHGTRPVNDGTRTKLQDLKQAQAQAQISLERAVFSISVFLAHEFVHCFTGFLTGSSQPGTPPALNASPYSDKEHGEAGWYWTRHTFGGLGHVWCGKDEPSEPGHFGVPMLLQYNKQRSQSFFYQMDHDVVRSIVGVDWAAANSLDPNWVLKLRDETTQTPFQEWYSAYEELVARNTATDGEKLQRFNLGIHLTVKSICAVLGRCDLEVQQCPYSYSEANFHMKEKTSYLRVHIV